MLTLCFGAFGTGKTTYLLEEIAADIEAGIPSFLVVPEQNTVIAMTAAIEDMQAEINLVWKHLLPAL